MATASRRSSVPEIASFAVAVLRVDDGTAYVEGRWSGIRGMRFLRPTLILDHRQVLAALEHKPWAPTEDGPWIATFPWDGDPAELARASLEVAPSVIVPLGPGAAAPRPRARAETSSGSVRALAPPTGRSVQLVQSLVADADLRAAPVAGPADRQPAAAPVARSAPEPEPEPGRDVRSELRREQSARAEAEQAARAVVAGRDRARAMHEEAVRDREAAVRTRDRMVEQRDEAITAAGAAARHRDEQIAAAKRDRDQRVSEAERRARTLAAERDEAREQRDQLRAQRDETLRAHRSLENLLAAERAGRDRDRGPAPAPAPPVPAAHADDDEFVDDTPLGIRAVPAASAVPADLLSARPAPRAPLGDFDRWALRVLAIATASCFLLLLLNLLSLFL